MPKKPTTWIDEHVGRRLQVLRKSSGVSQQKLAEQLGVTYQQVQKYEGGTNRVSTAFLLRVAQMFSVPLDYFFEGVDALAGQPLSEGADADAGKIAAFVATRVELGNGGDDAPRASTRAATISSSRSSWT